MPKDNASAEGEQIAALPIQRDKNGEFRILMVTSRDTGRWVMPKGWIMSGKTPWRAAEIEALEEAGAIGAMGSEALGEYHYDKVLDDGSLLNCRVVIFPMMVESLKKNWKERQSRKRRWFSPKGAASRVNEPELAALLLSLSKKSQRKQVIRTVKAAS